MASPPLSVKAHDIMPPRIWQLTPNTLQCSSLTLTSIYSMVRHLLDLLSRITSDNWLKKSRWSLSCLLSDRAKCVQNCFLIVLLFVFLKIKFYFCIFSVIDFESYTVDMCLSWFSFYVKNHQTWSQTCAHLKHGLNCLSISVLYSYLDLISYITCA